MFNPRFPLFTYGNCGIYVACKSYFAVSSSVYCIWAINGVNWSINCVLNCCIAFKSLNCWSTPEMVTESLYALQTMDWWKLTAIRLWIFRTCSCCKLVFAKPNTCSKPVSLITPNVLYNREVCVAQHIGTSFNGLFTAVCRFLIMSTTKSDPINLKIYSLKIT